MLYLVATPIGNLGDITLRALETLRTVDFVASEDTRKTGRLLKHFEIQKPQISFHEHNEHQAGERIVTLLREGKSLALVTDAGTPGISDPGFTLVRRVYEANESGDHAAIDNGDLTDIGPRHHFFPVLEHRPLRAQGVMVAHIFDTGSGQAKAGDRVGLRKIARINRCIFP